MHIRTRLAKLEQSYRKEYDVRKVFFVSLDDDKDTMEIPALEFVGTIDDGRHLIGQYPLCTFIIDDIPGGVDLNA